MVNNELTHWGIKGMKWGQRRYQNKDGSLTPAGKKRYEKELARVKAQQKIMRNKARTKAKFDKLEEMKKEIEDGKKEFEPQQKTSTHKPSPKPKKKSVKDMSDEELKQMIDRLNTEKQYRQLVSESEHANLSKGSQFVTKILKSAGEKSMENITTQVMNYAGTRIMNAVIEKVDPKGGVTKDKPAIFTNNNKKK